MKKKISASHCMTWHTAHQANGKMLESWFPCHANQGKGSMPAWTFFLKCEAQLAGRNTRGIGSSYLAERQNAASN